MNANEAIRLAAQYLTDKHIGFSEPIHIVEIEGSDLEIVFTAPGALNPNLVVDPPDVRVLVKSSSGDVALIRDM